MHHLHEKWLKKERRAPEDTSEKTMEASRCTLLKQAKSTARMIRMIILDTRMIRMIILDTRMIILVVYLRWQFEGIS